MDGYLHNDLPINSPSEDYFGVNPFATALAKSILNMRSPTGSVIALNGPWGSGKSSAVNLIRHHLDAAVLADKIVVINFACWWFRGEEALALAFFRELYAGMSPTLGERFKKSLPKLGARLLKAGAMAGEVADFVGAGGIGKKAGQFLDKLAGLIKQDESVEHLHRELTNALRDQSRKYLIVIDDIDRLSPDEALMIFRLVKSVGRLPNIMYLLVYDRQLAEKIVSERFPSEGPHYLEKIVQAAFELPEPMSTDIQRLLIEQIDNICTEDFSEAQQVRLMNILIGTVIPEIRTPRDVNRFTNSLAVTWPAVAGDVDPADFIALELFRLLHPDLYRKIRQNKDALCNIDHYTGTDTLSKRLNELFLSSFSGEQHDRIRNALRRVFPILESIWGNVVYNTDFQTKWAIERRACSVNHFDQYFRLALSANVLSAFEFDTFLSHIDKTAYVETELRRAALDIRPSGGTKSAVILDELKLHADRVKDDQILPLLTGLFLVADEINVDSDKQASRMVDNHIRLHWLCRRLTWGRLSLEKRSTIFLAACQSASLAWLEDFVDSAWNDYFPREGDGAEPEDRCLTTEADALTLRGMLLERIKNAAQTGELISSPNFTRLLYSWLELSDDQGKSAKNWVTDQLRKDSVIKLFVQACTVVVWTQGLGGSGLGDYVARKSIRANVSGLERFMDIGEFKSRVEALSKVDPEVAVFFEAWTNEQQNTNI